MNSVPIESTKRYSISTSCFVGVADMELSFTVRFKMDEDLKPKPWTQLVWIRCGIK